MYVGIWPALQCIAEKLVKGLTKELYFTIYFPQGRPVSMIHLFTRFVLTLHYMYCEDWLRGARWRGIVADPSGRMRGSVDNEEGTTPTVKRGGVTLAHCDCATLVLPVECLLSIYYREVKGLTDYMPMH